MRWLSYPVVQPLQRWDRGTQHIHVSGYHNVDKRSLWQDNQHRGNVACILVGRFPYVCWVSQTCCTKAHLWLVFGMWVKANGSKIILHVSQFRQAQWPKVITFIFRSRHQKLMRLLELRRVTLSLSCGVILRSHNLTSHPAPARLDLTQPEEVADGEVDLIDQHSTNPSNGCTEVIVCNNPIIFRILLYKIDQL